LVAGAAARLASFMPEGTEVQAVRGELRIPATTPALEDLLTRAMSARSDYRAGQRNLARYQIEEQAARRLRIPEPQVWAGVKRADVTSGIGPNPFADVTHTGVAASLSVPLPLFNNGRYEVARYQAEQEQAKARIAVLARQIRTEVQGARDVLAIRLGALTAYQREQESASAELTRIAQIAYQEGEVGILELLDSFRITRGTTVRTLDLEAGVKEALIELERAVGEEVLP
jgi:cobalt-zinc-cadmium efflux system outer membrane protein